MARSADAQSVVAGSTIGPYVVERELGRGGMAVVYLARDPRLEREVAVKLLANALNDDPTARERLVAEARAASRLDHPNIATVFDIGETGDGLVWVAMARYTGESLRDRIARGPLPLDDALELAAQVAAGLEAAHARGIVHRDVKPANIMITPDGVAKLLDFGIAKGIGTGLTRSGVILGTLDYMSPEQTFGDGVDARTDIWSLGVVLYEMLAGRHPFDEKSDVALLATIRQGTPAPLATQRNDLPDTVISVVERCLEKDAANRFAWMADLRKALTERGTLVALPTPSLRRSRTRRFAMMGVAATTLIVSALAIRARLRDRLPVVPSAASMMVLPFAPTVADTTLRRLGSDLAITLARALDGVDTIRVVDPILTLASSRRDGAVNFEKATALARRFGARSILAGSVVRSGSDVRVDATLREVATGKSLADASASGHGDSLTRLTDELAVQLLREVWKKGAAPVPSLAAVTTHSMSALRAYLDGERAVLDGRFRAAPDAFRRAITTDSTFWFAYLRYWYARAWHGLSVDSTVRAVVASHLDAFPEPDRMLALARLASDPLQRLQLLRQTTQVFPNHWQGWFEYADLLAHSGPMLGIPQSNAMDAFQSVVSLNPDLAPAWEHLLWIAVALRDTRVTDSALAALRRIRVDSLRADEVRFDLLQYYEYLAEMTRSRGVPNPALADTAAAAISHVRAVPSLGGLSTGLHIYGFHRAQIDLLDRIERLRPPAAVIAAHQYGRALAWAGRGAWDSAAVAADRFARDGRRGELEFFPVQIATLGALIGALDANAAVTRLRRAENDAKAMPVTDETRNNATEAQAELLWLGGVQAFNRRDERALRNASDKLRALPVESSAPVLRRSLSALARALAGRTHEAGDSLFALEQDNARGGRVSLGEHPALTAVDRLLAARWLVDAGDTTKATGLLTFYETIFPAPLSRMHNINLARGEHESAGRLYALVIERLDRPMPALRSVREDAERALRVVQDPTARQGIEIPTVKRK